MEIQYTFSSLFSLDYEISDIVAMHQKWKEGDTFEMSYPRKTSAFLYLNGCSAKYICKNGESFVAKQGSIVYIPYGSVYRTIFENTGHQPHNTHLLEFNIKINGEIISVAETPFIVAGGYSISAAELIKNSVKIYESPLRSSAALKSDIYKILYELGLEEKSTYNKKFLPISAGIKYMEQNTLANISIEEIADMCGVSCGCFSSLFKVYSGKSPHKYRLDFKIEMAKQMLKSGYMTVEVISDSLMFESASYFCKIFKKKTGLTPSQYRNYKKS